MRCSSLMRLAPTILQKNGSRLKDRLQKKVKFISLLLLQKSMSNHYEIRIQTVC